MVFDNKRARCIASKNGGAFPSLFEPFWWSKSRAKALKKHVFRPPFSRARFEVRKCCFSKGPEPRKHRFYHRKTMIFENWLWCDGGCFSSHFGYQKSSKINEKAISKSIRFSTSFFVDFLTIVDRKRGPKNHRFSQKWSSEGVLGSGVASGMYFWSFWGSPGVDFA